RSRTTPTRAGAGSRIPAARAHARSGAQRTTPGGIARLDWNRDGLVIWLAAAAIFWVAGAAVDGLVRNRSLGFQRIGALAVLMGSACLAGAALTTRSGASAIWEALPSQPFGPVALRLDPI